MNVASIAALSLLCAAPLVDDAAAPSVTLVEDGQPRAIIVTGNAPSAATRQAVDDLRMWLRAVSGADLLVRTESEIGDATDGAAPRGLVLVGDTKRTRALGIDPDALDLEEVVVRAFPGALVITGDDARPDGLPLRGSVLAVDVFAEEVLGVRMLWPGELGTVVPQQTTIVATDIDIRAKPALVDRSILQLGFNRVTHAKIDALGWDREAYGKYQAESELWFRFHRLGGSYNGNFGHAYGSYWERFRDEHPEWFALQPDGTRDNSQSDSARHASHRLCTSNPALIRQVAADVIAKLRADARLDGVSISPNDDGDQTFCLCERCEALDVPDGEQVVMRTRGGTISHVSLSDRYARFYSAIAALVEAELPGRHVGAYAYGGYSNAPLREKLHPNVLIGLVPDTTVYLDDSVRKATTANWARWSKLDAKLFVRPNSLMALHALPVIHVRKLAQDIVFWKDNGMSVARFDCNFHHWATNGLNYYVLAKLLWKPYRPVDVIVEEYCEAGFGTAATAVRYYFGALQRIADALAAEQRPADGAMIAHFYTDAVLRKLRRQLEVAMRAAGDDEVVKKRIAFLQRGLDYVPICRDYLVAKEAGPDSGPLAEQRARRMAWFRELGPSRVVHAPWLLYWDW